MNALANPALNLAPFETGGDSHCDFKLEPSGEFYIEIQMAEKQRGFRLDIRVS